MADEKEFVAAPLFTVSEAAKYLGVYKKMVYQLIEHGEITSIKVKGAVRVERKSLDEFRASGRMM